MIDNLKTLCNLDGVSGNEEKVRDFIISQIDGFCEYNVDSLGNIIAFKKGKKTPKYKVMLDAHMDEVGLIITDILDSGFLKFEIVGGIDISCVMNKRVRINGKINGVVSSRPIHLLSSEQKKKLPKVSELYIDIGANERAEAQKYVNLGDTAVLCGDFEDLGENFVSKAVDDRVGCATLIDLIRNYDEYDFYASFSTQEEVGLRGARVSAYTINPDFAIILEATTAADIAGVPHEKTVCELSNGAVVSFMDKACVYDKKLYDVALNSNIPCQAKRMIAGGNNTGAIHLSREGVRCIAISLAARYIHSSSTVCNYSDIQSYRLLAEYMLNKISSGEVD